MRSPLNIIIKHDFTLHADGHALRCFLDDTIDKVGGIFDSADIELRCPPCDGIAGENIRIRIGHAVPGKFRILYYYKDCWLVETDYDFYDYVRSGQTRCTLIGFARAMGVSEMWVYNDGKVTFEGDLDEWITANRKTAAVFGEVVDDYEWDGSSLGEVIAANEEFLHRYDIYYDPFEAVAAELLAKKEAEAVKAKERARIEEQKRNEARAREQNTGLFNVSAADIGTITLRNGVVIPRFGYGVGSWTSWGTVAGALEMGFRMVRTLGDCQSEAATARGIKESGMARDEIFVVSCLEGVNSRDAAVRQIDKLLESLDSDYIDLLIMAALPQQTDVYRAMEDAFKVGKVRSLGVSGYAPQVGFHLPQYSLADLEKQVEVMPDVSEFEANFLTILPEVDKLRKCGTAVFSESPLSRWSDVNNFEQISAIAARHGVSNAQVALRYLYQHGILFAVSADKEWEMRRLMSVAGFSLSDEEMNIIIRMNLGQSYSNPIYIR